MADRAIRGRMMPAARSSAAEAAPPTAISHADSLAGPKGPSGIVHRLTLDPRSVTASEVRRLQGVAGNHAVGQLMTMSRSSRPTAAPPIQRQVVLKQMQGGESAVSSLDMLKKWLARFGVLEIVQRSPLRMAKLMAMFEGAATYTFPWLLEGDTERFLNEIDGVPLFAGVEHALPLIPQHGYTFFDHMHHEAPGVFVSEARVRFVTDLFTSGRISSQVLAAASDQVAIQSKSADDCDPQPSRRDDIAEQSVGIEEARQTGSLGHPNAIAL